MAVHILPIILVIITYLIYLMKRRYNYWKSKGVKFPTPLPIIGNYGDLFFVKRSPDDFLHHLYESFPEEKVVGFFRGWKPAILIRDPEIVKQILIKDFNIFPGRGLNKLQTEAGLSSNLFSIEGELWKILRHKLTPTFTSKKIKDMLPLINTCIYKLNSYTEKVIRLESDYELRSLISKYSMDVIGSCAFGMDLQMYASEKNHFIEVSNEMTRPNMFTRLWYLIDFIIPGIKQKIPNLDPTAHFRDFFLKLVYSVIKERERKQYTKKDFMDLMIELKNQGKASINYENGLSEVDISDMLIAAQAFIFYVAGFETSSTTISYLLYNLAQNQDIQDRVYEEICEVYKKYNEELTYESIKDFTYLKMAFDETIRKHTPLGTLVRECEKDYTVPGTNLTIEKGIPVFISTSGIHVDPKYYPNPDEFNPEFFSPENKKCIPQGAYLPFGAGPRQCIGMRFANTQMYLFTASFLKKFKVDVCPRTKTKIEYDPASFSRLAKDGLWVKVSKRD